MKKLLSSLFVVALLAFSAQDTMAQYQQGDKLLNVGIGLGGYYNYGGYYGGLYGGGGGVTLGGSFEYGFTDQISAGAQVDFYSRSFGGYRFSSIPIALRGSYHVNELLNLNNDKIDLYGGLQLGYTIESNNLGVGDYRNGRALFGVHLGGRYYFQPNLGAFAEVGYGVTAVKLGVTFKF